MRRQRLDADLQHGREITDRFLLARATETSVGLLDMLSEDVVVWTDGRKVRAAVRPVVGLDQLEVPDERGQEGGGRAARGHSQRATGQRLHGRRHRGGGHGPRYSRRHCRGGPGGVEPRQARAPWYLRSRQSEDVVD